MGKRKKDDFIFKDIISINDPISSLKVSHPILVQAGTTMKKVISELQEKSIGCVLVLDNEELIGIFTERDILLKVLGKGLNVSVEIIDDYMTRSPIKLRMTDPIAFVLDRMFTNGFRHVPIVDEGNRPVGIISYIDIVNMIANYFAHKIIQSQHDKMP